jgi:hypothetical protein
LHRPIDLVRAYLHFRRTLRQTKRVPGFIGAAFALEDPWTCYTISFWRDPAAIARFGTSAPDHLRAARDLIGRLRFQPDRGPELWSTKWLLWSVSSNLNWATVDLRSCLERTARTVWRCHECYSSTAGGCNGGQQYVICSWAERTGLGPQAALT